MSTPFCPMVKSRLCGSASCMIALVAPLLLRLTRKACWGQAHAPSTRMHQTGNMLKSTMPGRTVAVRHSYTLADQA